MSAMDGRQPTGSCSGSASSRRGERIEQRIGTEADRFAAVLGKRTRARILIEASTDSEFGRPLSRLARP